MMMTPICYLDEAFFIVLCVGYLVCAAQQIGLPDFQLINWTILFLINGLVNADLHYIKQEINCTLVLEKH